MKNKTLTQQAIKLTLVFTLAIAGLSFLAACERTIKVSDKNITEIKYKELDETLASTKNNQIVIVDVRSTEKFNKGHIPGAIHIHLPDLVPGDARLSAAKYIVVYGDNLGDPLPRAAAKRLMSQGYKGVQDFRGGIEAWQSHGRTLDLPRH